MATDLTPSGGRHRAAGPRGRAPVATRPGATGPRLDGLDAARGLAVLVMLVAYLSPVGGALDVAQYLAAPLFVVVLGVGVVLRMTRARPDRPRFVADEVVRGILLVLLGVVLQAAYGQVDVVLPYLGVLVVVLAPLALVLRPVPVLTLGLVVGGAVLGPLVTERVRDHVLADPSAAAGVTGHLLRWLATGSDHRLVSFLPMALAGLVLALLLPHLTRLVPTVGIAAVLLGAGGVVKVIGDGTADGAGPSSGTTAEVVAVTFLAAGAVVASFALVLLVRGRATVLEPALHVLLAVGRLTLTAYTLLILVLALLSLARDGAPDDTWPVLLVTTVVVVGACWGLDRRFGTGPLEVLVRVVRLPSRGRHGVPVRSPRPARER
ncbi:DUF418 domain-containing protein [Nostocoides sp. Soil756]|jgi:uncharacterized membrane protein YeiB|uniref:DUF418 domain-containing protein n=1 Tax=Nostocoides sp. Soil756 TaxID=1736399 RepID=UPI0006F3C214|nr:DUF418 domain-containing protein [Tetrasphaera sp. Soil756]KRE62142.1 hypothetical protein ASG78_03565 [Tetrasphaera sp. Soil756]